MKGVRNLRKRNHSIIVRLSDDELEQLQAKIKSSGQTIQSYILDAALNGKITSAEEIKLKKKENEILADIDKQLRGMGTNINQMAHVANGKGEIPTAEKLLRMARDVFEVKKEVNVQWLSTRRSISQLKHMEQ